MKRFKNELIEQVKVPVLLSTWGEQNRIIKLRFYKRSLYIKSFYNVFKPSVINNHHTRIDNH